MSESDESTPRPLGLTPSFGFGDRLGLATPGHVAAMRAAGHGVAPIFAQQSIREMVRTGRTPEGVMGDALSGARDAGWHGAQGADADHLKTPADVEATAAAGFTFFTLDPSDHVDGKAEDYDAAELESRYEALDEPSSWAAKYTGRQVKLAGGAELSFDETSLKRAAVKYGRAVQEAIALAGHIERVQSAAGRGYEIELSIDETPRPTTLLEHYLIAEEFRAAGVALISLAPRFVGDFEKGVDFKGNLGALADSLRDHAAIAEMLGPYKLSLHSGSDKLSMYALLAEATRGRYHVKTAGTSYLEAVRVAARSDEALFRRIIEFSRGRYETDRATYHVSAKLTDAPSAEGNVVETEELERQYLGLWDETPTGEGFTQPGRQILHCTFGSVLTDDDLGPALKGLVADRADVHSELLCEHFTRHLAALQSGWNAGAM